MTENSKNKKAIFQTGIRDSDSLRIAEIDRACYGTKKTGCKSLFFRPKDSLCAF